MLGAVSYDTVRRSIAHLGTKFSEKISAFFCRVVEGSRFVQNVVTYLPVCMMS